MTHLCMYKPKNYAIEENLCVTLTFLNYTKTVAMSKEFFVNVSENRFVVSRNAEDHIHF